ncbi:MAG: FAD-dependent thymidylate synthase [Oscillospiraceae bacterium]|nr:FAD-dependent thymidylate synthase [Oscillospiraceae bacterium]
MKVELLSHTPNPDKLVAAAAKLCYSAAEIDNILEGLTPDKTESFLTRLVDLGHESPMEHASFTFGIEGVSRALLAQFTRHRIASFSVQSQRYVGMEGFEFVTPPEIAADPTAHKTFLDAMASAQTAYDTLRDSLTARYVAEMVTDGTEEAAAKRTAVKKANEDARFVLPNAATTKIVATMNTRSLLNFFHLRCCRRAQWEINALAWEMLDSLREVAPLLFKLAGPGCIKGRCPEGEMSCRQPYKR